MEDASVIFRKIFGKGEENINELGLVKKEEKTVKEISYDRSLLRRSFSGLLCGLIQ